MERVDLDKITQEEQELMFKQSKLLFKLNHTEPMTEEYTALLNELLDNNIGETVLLQHPLQVRHLIKLKLETMSLSTITAWQWQEVELQ